MMKRLINCLHDLNLVLNQKFTVPIFRIKSKNIVVIREPTEFYNTLKKLSEQSTKRISISSLYIGTDNLEKDLIESFSKAKHQSPDLNLNILLDYNRATRETLNETKDQKQSSKSLLLPLLKQGANINFYLTHLSSRYLRLFNRPKWNELISLHHMKLYIFDNDIIISGANLSHTYFTNRQDRYLLIRDSPDLCDYFDQLIKTISKFSLNLQTNGDFQLNNDWKYDPRKFLHRYLHKHFAKKELFRFNEQFLAKNQLKISNFNDSETDTIVFPLLQMKTFDICDEENFTTNLLMKQWPKNETNVNLNIATGYFNLIEKYQKKILENPHLPMTKIVMASEEANGFYQGNGLLYYVPYVYTYYVKKFLKKIEKTKAKSLIQINYYNRSNWSFHGKGIWLQTPDYYLTLIGSTNFGYRSVFRDNEAQLIILTENNELIEKFQNEFNDIVNHSRMINDWRKDLPTIPILIPYVALICRSLF